jgi:hypothetical protein
MTIEEAQAWVAPKQLTEAEVAFVHLLVKGTIKGSEHILYGRCYLELEDALLEQLIPAEFQVLRWGDVEPIEIELQDFLLLPPRKVEGGTTSIITLCSRDQRGSMSLPMPAWRIGAWGEAVIPFGYSVADFLSQEQADAKLADDDDDEEGV